MLLNVEYKIQGQVRTAIPYVSCIVHIQLLCVHVWVCLHVGMGVYRYAYACALT